MIGFKKELNLEFDEAISKVKKELSKEGFGIISEINIKDTLKKKINADFEDYIILGTCNPKLAYEAIKMEKDIGLLLPCNVIVFKENNKVFISLINPSEMLSIIKNNKINEIAQAVESKFREIYNKI